MHKSARAARGLARASFVGRDAELAALDAALARAAGFKAPQTVTIVGPLGIGKSRLCEEWIARKSGAGLRGIRAAAPPVLEEGRSPAPRALVADLLRHRFAITGAGVDSAEALRRFRGEL